ncbi:G-protein coupled receptor 4-like [Ambystoma mexicanum]|uniref:G-protein coupled receptor 4-like n=1 Tax=Ambystoma mexicanum TaxID=8296 RepID=UPI0037E71B5A
MNSENVTCSYPEKYEAILFPIIYGFVFIVGIIGNLMAVGIIILQIRRKNVLSIYLANLCASDLMYIFTLPVWIVYTAKEDWQFGALTCKIVGFFFNSNVYSTITFLSCIAIDRFLGTVFPMQSMNLRSMKAAMLVSTVIWLIILATHSVFLARDDLFNATQAIDLCYEKYPMDKWMAHLNYFRIFVVFLVPLVLLVFSYCAIIRAINHSPSLERVQKQKITSLLLAMIFIFVVCYLPYHVVLFIRSYASDVSINNCEVEIKIRPAYRITFALTSLTSALDPFINIFASDSVKQDTLEELRDIGRWLRAKGRKDKEKRPYLKTVCDCKRPQNADKGLLDINQSKPQTRL